MDSFLLFEVHVLNPAIQPRPPVSLSLLWDPETWRNTLASALLFHHLNIVTQSATGYGWTSLFLTLSS